MTGVRQPAFYVPVNLDPGLFAPGHWPCAAYLLNLIRWKWICWRADENGYVRLTYEHLRTVIRDDEILNVVRHRLAGLQVIRHSRKWKPGEYSQGYEIAPEYRETKRIVCEDIRLAKRIAKAYQTWKMLPVHRRLDEHLARVELDMPRAEWIISEMVPDSDSPMTVADYRQRIRQACLTIANGDSRIDCVDRFGRVHTPLTRLPKELRCCLRIGGEPLVSLDLANSQPLIAGIVATTYFRNRYAALRLREREFRDDADTNPYHRRMPEAVDWDQDHSDLAEYLRVCERGQIYESLMRPGDDRECMKVDFLTALYSKNSLKTALKRTLAVRYPSLNGMLFDLKKRNHAHAAHLMQNTEATIFIGGICERIFDQSPDVPILSLHDAIFTTPFNVQCVKEAMMDTFQTLNLRPTIKQTDHDDDVAESKIHNQLSDTGLHDDRAS